MSYVQTSTRGANEMENLSSIESNIGNMAFDLVWSGSSHSALIGNLGGVLNKIGSEKGKLSSFFAALNDLEIYKQNKERIQSLQFKLALIPDNKKNAGERASISQEIANLTAQNKALRSKIESVMASITSIGASGNLVSYNVDFNYITGVRDLLARYQGRLSPEEEAAGLNYLRQLQGQSLASYYNRVDENGNVIEGSGLQYINGVIGAVQSTYTGREAAVNSALAILKLASDKGVKLDYEHKGTTGINPYVRTEDIVTGVDCNPFVSWVVDKGTPNGFQWRAVEGFHEVGTGISYNNWTNAQPGDVFVTSGHGSRHVGMIIENDPVNGVFITAEASGQNAGILLQTRSYNSLRQSGYQVRDMTSVYNGTENTDREVFKQYQV